MALLAEQLLAHLDEERQAILVGAYDVLHSLGAAKTLLFAQMDRNPPPRDMLALIGRRAARNMRLMDTAIRGIKDAADRIAQLREVRRGFDTYGADGRKQVHPTSDPTVERKA